MRRRVKALIFLVGTAITLFAVNAFYISNHNPMLNENQKEIDTTRVSAQALFDKSWSTIRAEYYDPNFNLQKWVRWKNHYQGKIKTEEDAKVAI